MSLLTEEQRLQLAQVWLRAPDVNETCIGCCACVAISPEVFDMNDEWVSVVQYRENYEDIWVDDSIMACPVNAISWKE